MSHRQCAGYAAAFHQASGYRPPPASILSRASFAPACLKLKGEETVSPLSPKYLRPFLLVALPCAALLKVPKPRRAPAFHPSRTLDSNPLNKQPLFTHTHTPPLSLLSLCSRPLLQPLLSCGTCSLPCVFLLCALSSKVGKGGGAYRQSWRPLVLKVRAMSDLTSGVRSLVAAMAARLQQEIQPPSLCLHDRILFSLCSRTAARWHDKNTQDEGKRERRRALQGVKRENQTVF